MYMNIPEDDLNFLKEYIRTPSPSGHEQEAQKCWLQYIRPYIDDYIVDLPGSVAGIINPGQKYKVVIEAHVDQVCYYVSYIDKKGYISVVKIGGADPVIAPSKEVIIHTEQGMVKGIFGWPAPHVRASSENTPSLNNIFIEVGCSSKKEVLDLGIEVGCPVTYYEEVKLLNDCALSGPAMDNKIGGFIIAQVAKKVFGSAKKLPFTLYAVNSVLEETGKTGALIMGNNIRPDVALVTDVTHDTQAPMYDKKTFGDIAAGKGPVLSYAPSVQKNLLAMIRQTAEKNNIPFQKKTLSKTTGTDSDSFAYSDSGVASALIAMPLKYMHTTVETIYISDVYHTIHLMYQFLMQLNAGHDFRYFK
jgi:putative aminopeptidase FrvX